MGYCIEHLPSRISIGRETETGVTDIRIDCTDGTLTTEAVTE